MPNSILVVDDGAVNRKLTETVLSGAGYEADGCEDAESALASLSRAQPRAVLTDLRLRGMDGLELVRRIKGDPRLRDTVVIAVTGSVDESDRQNAFEAGCDDYVVKPIDTRTFPELLKAHLSRHGHGNFLAASPATLSEGAPAWLAEMRGDFFRSESLLAQRLLAWHGIHGQERALRESAHLWAGLGQTFGHSEITTLAQQVEGLLERSDDQRDRELDALLRRLSAVFARAPQGPVAVKGQNRVQARLAERLAGTKMVLDNLGAHDMTRVGEVLREAGVEVLDPDPAGMDHCDLVIAPAEAAKLEYHWRNPSRPLLLVGSPLTDAQIDLFLEIQAWEFVAAPWTCEELLARACRLLSRPAAPVGPIARPGKSRVSVLLADDDATTLALLKTTMENDGMECAVATDGDQALTLMRATPPDIAVLEAIMPNKGGFEVLADIRNEPALRHVRVMLLTTLQQESDIVRGFALGADDYVTKPFSPVEVMARLKRLARSGA